MGVLDPGLQIAERRRTMLPSDDATIEPEHRGAATIVATPAARPLPQLLGEIATPQHPFDRPLAPALGERRHGTPLLPPEQHAEPRLLDPELRPQGLTERVEPLIGPGDRQQHQRAEMGAPHQLLHRGDGGLHLALAIEVMQRSVVDLTTNGPRSVPGVEPGVAHELQIGSPMRRQCIERGHGIHALAEARVEPVQESVSCMPGPALAPAPNHTRNPERQRLAGDRRLAIQQVEVGDARVAGVDPLGEPTQAVAAAVASVPG